MKQTFYLNKYTDNSWYVFLSTNIKEGSTAFSPIGTITLDVEPIKKEVEKVIENPCIFRSLGSGLQVTQTIPSDAYNVKVTYTVKE